jgi:excisionase family DNA binding protein
LPANERPDPEWLTIQELMAFAKVSRRTCYNWLAKNQIAVRRTPGGRIRINKADLFPPEPAHKPAHPARTGKP